MRPIAELMFNDFIGFGLDPILNQGAKMRYMFGGKAKIPLCTYSSWRWSQGTTFSIIV